jgi:hypothetical protein
VRINFEVTYADGTKAPSTATIADQCAFEKEFNKSIAELASAFRMTDMAWLAWHGLRRLNAGTPDFEVWLDSVDSVEMAEDEGIVPLETAQPTG